MSLEDTYLMLHGFCSTMIYIYNYRILRMGSIASSSTLCSLPQPDRQCAADKEPAEDLKKGGMWSLDNQARLIRRHGWHRNPTHLTFFFLSASLQKQLHYVSCHHEPSIYLAISSQNLTTYAASQAADEHRRSAPRKRQDGWAPSIRIH